MMLTHVPVVSPTSGGLAKSICSSRELLGVVEAVAVVADAADERTLPAELRAGDDRVGDGAAGDEPRLVIAERAEQLLLLGRIDEPHRRPFEREGRELRVGEFEEDIDQRVAEADEVEFVRHRSAMVCGNDRGLRGSAKRQLY